MDFCRTKLNGKLNHLLEAGQYQASLFYQLLHSHIAESEEICCRYNSESKSYKELYARMCMLNGALAGMQRGKVAIYCPKSFDAYAAIYTVFLSGNTWVPISENVPSDRNAAIIEAISPDIFLVGGPVPEFVSSYAVLHGIDIVCIDNMTAVAPRQFVTFNHENDDVAYVLFTSGSTGVPKGVPMTHQNFINFIINCFDILPFEMKDVFGDFHDFTFDLSIFYLFCAPFVEGALVPATSAMDKCFPLRFIKLNEITIWSSVPSSIRQIMATQGDGLLETSIRIMFLCGEPLSLSIVSYCFDKMNVNNVYNFYGLTETGVENFYHRLVPEDVQRFSDQGLAPIGKPLPGNHIRITPDKELIIGGCQITPGYIGNIETQRFFEDAGIRWFLTGDIVEEVEGVIVHKGRRDSQIKLNGYRIELLDIESVIRQFSGVVDAVCLCIREQEGDYLAVAYQTRQDSYISEDSLIDFARSQLPRYMVPKFFKPIDLLPVNKNGKTDRQAILSWLLEYCVY